MTESTAKTLNDEMSFREIPMPDDEAMVTPPDEQADGSVDALEELRKYAPEAAQDPDTGQVRVMLPEATPLPAPDGDKDPWIHRSVGMRCPTCMWFVPKTDEKQGRCRRHAPTLGGYPVVMRNDWCGDHKLK